MTRLFMQNLYGVHVYRHFNQFFVLAYRADTKEDICYALINHYIRLVNWRLYKQTIAVADAERCIERIAGNNNPPERSIGLFYVSGNPNEFAWPLARRISDREYAELLTVGLARAWERDAAHKDGAQS